MNAIDTNILLYARDPRDRIKQEVAIELVQSLSDAVLLWQVACEYISASRKLEALGYGRSHAWDDIGRLARVWPLRLPTGRVLSRAQSLSEAHSLSVWDAFLMAACAEANVENLYT
jgi:predicted nucleic acid-binding protein